MTTHHSINYIELPSSDNAQMKAFYGSVFGWTFVDWGEHYVAFHGAGVEGGFDATPGARLPGRQGALVVLYSSDLEATESAVRAAGAQIVEPPFDFPGGRRFQFLDPSGNELAVWITVDTLSG